MTPNHTNVILMFTQVTNSHQPWGYMKTSETDSSLSSTLLNLASSARKHKCSLANVFEELNQESRSALDAVIGSNASALSITKALRAEGFAIDRGVFTEKRVCYLENKNCTCRGMVK